MIYTLLGLVALIVCGSYMLRTSGYSDFMDVVGTISIVIGVTGLMFYSILAHGWVAAGYQARIINGEYGTSYTQADVFYASNVIDTVREIDRNRVEVNGDLMRGRHEKR